jgi:hypothetical protein
MFERELGKWFSPLPPRGVAFLLSLILSCSTSVACKRCKKQLKSIIWFLTLLHNEAQIASSSSLELAVNWLEQTAAHLFDEKSNECEEIM